MEIRIANVNDAKDLLEIYRYYVEHTAISFEWDVPSVKEFERRIADTLPKYPFLVAVDNGEIIGYAYTHTFIARQAYDWCVETTIYLKQGYGKKGVGKALYNALEEISKLQGVLNITACIGVTDNEDEYLTNNSFNFHIHMGYKEVGRFTKCGHKFNRWYDMVWVEKIIGDHGKDNKPIIPFDKMDKTVIKAILSK